MKKSLIFVALTLIVAAAAWYITERRAPETDVATPPLFPELAAHVNDAARIEIRTRLNKVILARSGDGWVVENRDGFPALIEKVKHLAVDFSGLKIIEAKTGRPELYSRLGVEDLEVEKSTSTLVTFTDAGGKVLASLYVGKQREGAHGPLAMTRYVRRPDDKQSYLVEGDLDLTADPLTWMNRELADIKSDRIHEISIEHPGKPALVAGRDKPEDINFQLRGMPQGFKEISDATVTSLSTILQELRFDDVKARTAVKWPEQATVATLRGFDGLVATVRTAVLDDARQYSMLEFGYDASAAKPAAATNPEAAAPATPASAPSAKVEEEVRTLNDRVKQWVYVLPEFKTRMATRTMDDLIVKVEAPPALPPDPLKVEHFDHSGRQLPEGLPPQQFAPPPGSETGSGVTDP